MKGQGILPARVHPRVKVAWRTLTVLCAMVMALGAWQAAARPERMRAALVDEGETASDPVWEAVSSLVPMEGFTLNGFSSSPLVVGWTSSDRPEVALMEVDQGLRASGWHPVGHEDVGMLSYVHEPAALPDGRKVSCAFVIIGETPDGTTSVVMELG